VTGWYDRKMAGDQHALGRIVPNWSLPSA